MNEDLSFPLWVKKTHLSYLMESAESEISADYVKDDEGSIILMKYIGPLPSGQTKRGKFLSVVAHSNPTSVHPAKSYSYQRYSTKPKPAKYYSLD